MSYIPGIIECYEKLFAIISMERGFITPDDLINALVIQVIEQAEHGEQRFFREIFLDQHVMSIKQVIEVCEVIFQNSSTISTRNMDCLTSTLKNINQKYFRFTEEIMWNLDTMQINSASKN